MQNLTPKNLGPQSKICSKIHFPEADVIFFRRSASRERFVESLPCRWIVHLLDERLIMPVPSGAVFLRPRTGSGSIRREPRTVTNSQWSRRKTATGIRLANGGKKWPARYASLSLFSLFPSWFWMSTLSSHIRPGFPFSWNSCRRR